MASSASYEFNGAKQNE